MSEERFSVKLQRVQSKLKCPKDQYNNFGKYKYRSCESILEAVKPLLAEEQLILTISDAIECIGNRIYVKATATLTDGESEISTTAFAREEEQKKGMDGSQVTGAASSYARKYALNGLFAIDDTKDADGLDNRQQSPQTHGQEQFPPQVDANGESLTEIFNVYAKPAIEQAKTKEDLTRIYNDYKSLQTMREFVSALTARRKALGI